MATGVPAVFGSQSLDIRPPLAGYVVDVAVAHTTVHEDAGMLPPVRFEYDVEAQSRLWSLWLVSVEIPVIQSMFEHSLLSQPCAQSPPRDTGERRHSEL